MFTACLGAWKSYDGKQLFCTHVSLNFLELPLEPTTSKRPLTQYFLFLTLSTNTLQVSCTLGPKAQFLFLPLELIISFHLVEICV